MERWKDVVGFEGLYMVSDEGRVWSNLTDRILKPSCCKNGYPRLILRRGGKSHGRCVHRLVAEAFIPNANNLPEINHKDENKSNNYASNLEWCTQKYNSNYGTKIARCAQNTDYEEVAKKNRKPVAQCTVSGEVINIWPSLKQCAKDLGFDNSAIARCCRGKSGTSYGFKWRYIDKTEAATGL